MNRTHMITVGTYCKHNENSGFYLQPIEYIKEVQVWFGSVWKRKGHLRVRFGTYGECKENIRVAWEPMESVKKVISCV